MQLVSTRARQARGRRFESGRLRRRWTPALLTTEYEGLVHGLRMVPVGTSP